LATGTSCLALVCVIGRRRVPLPPERISPFRGSIGASLSSIPGTQRRVARPSVDPAELSMIPADATQLDELEPDTLARLRCDRVACLRWQLERRRLISP